MESIEEKSMEFANRNPLMSRRAFEAGANYVLECLENLPTKTMDVFNLIEQLKK